MKQRFSSADVRVIACELGAQLTSLRLSNVYDLSSRIFLLKFAKPGKREQLLVDSGFRCHLTSFTRTAASAPSAFVRQLRKYLKTRRVTGISQIGTDRVIELSFSEGQYRLFLEFFAAGNIVLTDAELNVLALQRLVNEGDETVDVRVGAKYVLHAKQNYHGMLPVTTERVKAALDKAQERVKAAAEIGGKKAKRAKGADDLRKALSAGFPEYPPQLLEHVFTLANVDSSWKISDVLGDSSHFDKIMLSLNDAATVLQNLGQPPVKGYIIAKAKSDSKEQGQADTQPPSREAVLYEDFQPFRPAQFENKPGVYIFEFEGFNKTVDEFYSSLESQRLESRLNEHELAAQRKFQKVKDEHEKRLGALQQVQELHIRKAQAIEANTHRVEEARAAINGLIGQGMDWVDIAKLLENEQSRGNVVATMVKLPLKLEENTITLLLDEPGFDQDQESDEEDRTDDEDDSDDDEAGDREREKEKEATGDKRLAIDIDLALSSWANARQYYDQKKQAAVKEQKTAQASSKALKSTEKKIQEDLKKGLKQEKDILRPARRQFWFEKFLWFISSDGYLVLGGKDVEQNELLYRRHLNKGDIFVHADLNGASSVIVKNNPQTPDAPIPPSTLSQAGALTVCTSTAWDSKAVMAAWWVNADQVSKTAQTGEYLATGGFMIRGKKNFLPPSQLLLGFGVAWLISEESRVNHGKHRLVINRGRNTEDGSLDDQGADSKERVESGADNVTEQEQQQEEQQEEQQDEGGKEEESPSLETTEAKQEGNKEEKLDPETAAKEAEDSEAEEARSDNEDEDGQRSNPLQPNGHPSGAGDDGDSGSEADDDDDNQSQSEGVDLPAQVSEDTSPPRSSTPSTTTVTTTTTAAAAAAAAAKNKAPARGKRSKAKRAAKKYEWQDDRDRELAMSLLGSNKAAERKKSEEEDRAAKQAKLEAEKEHRRKQHEKKAERERERQARIARGEVAVGEADEVDAEQAEQERKEHANIDLLVPVAEPEDELLAAVPVIAPWGALGRFKYKVKLQPGGVKKGKAMKEIVNAWTALGSLNNGGKGAGRKILDTENRDKERVWPKEIELIKAWRVEEIVGLLPVKGVRVVQSGGLGGANSGGGGGNSKGAATGGGRAGGGGGGGGGKKKGR